MDIATKVEAMARALHAVDGDPFVGFESLSKSQRLALRTEADELLTALEIELEYSDRWSVVTEEETDERNGTDRVGPA